MSFTGGWSYRCCPVNSADCIAQHKPTAERSRFSKQRKKNTIKIAVFIMFLLTACLWIYAEVKERTFCLWWHHYCMKNFSPESFTDSNIPALTVNTQRSLNKVNIFSAKLTRNQRRPSKYHWGSIITKYYYFMVQSDYSTQKTSSVLKTLRTAGSVELQTEHSKVP